MEKSGPGGDAVKQLVTIYTEGRFWVGSIDLLPKERLSDLLNNAFVDREKKYHRFLQINNVTVTKVDNVMEGRMKTVFINKASVLIVVPQDAELSRGIGNGGDTSNSPFIPKTSVFTNLSLPGYDVRGNIHCTAGQTPCSLFDEHPGFIPLTNVNIRAPGSRASWAYPFAAVNREQVLSFVADTTDSSS